MNDPITTSEPVTVDLSGSALDEWIAGATIAKRSVPIYGKLGLYAEYEALDRDYERAKDEAEQGVELAGSEVKTIKARMRDLRDEWMASKSTWTVHALTSEGMEALATQKPELVEPVAPEPPTAPDPLPARHTDQQAKSFTLATQAHEKALADYRAASAVFEKEITTYSTELNLRGVAAAVERIEFADGRVVDSVTVEQLRTMRTSLGERQVASLVAATQLAALEETEIPAPFSQTDSETDPTS